MSGLASQSPIRNESRIVRHQQHISRCRHIFPLFNCRKRNEKNTIIIRSCTYRRQAIEHRRIADFFYGRAAKAVDNVTHERPSWEMEQCSTVCLGHIRGKHRGAWNFLQNGQFHHHSKEILFFFNEIFGTFRGK